MKFQKAIAFWTVAWLLAVVFPAVAQEARVVDCPQVTGKRTLSLYLSRVTCSPQWTALELKSYDSPGNAAQISPESFLKGLSTGRKYRLLRAEGIVPGEKKTVPETGMLPFTLYFEPLDAADDCFDFMESEADYALQLRGIVLRPAEPVGKIHCRIEGTVRGEGQNTLLHLQEYGKDSRIQMPVLIPVEEGHFAYDLYTDAEKVYYLEEWRTAFSSGHFYPFFAEADTLRISFDLSHYESTRVEGGVLNPLFCRLNYFEQDRWRALENTRDSLEKHGLYFTEAMADLLKARERAYNDSAQRVLYEQYEALKAAGSVLTPAGQSVEDRFSAFFEDMRQAQAACIRSGESLVGYFFFLTRLEHEGVGNDGAFPDSILQLAGHYADRYPAHPYTRTVRTLIAARTMDMPGSKALDFTADDLDGKPHRFSELSAGKIVFLDLWASWCGPCRQHSKEMIPVYEAYKDKGFTVVAVAREAGNTKAMQAAQAQDGYPWPSLVDLDDRHAVWERLGAGNAGGKTWLIGRDGTVLMVNPTAEEVRKYLSEHLD